MNIKMTAIAACLLAATSRTAGSFLTDSAISFVDIRNGAGVR